MRTIYKLFFLLSFLLATIRIHAQVYYYKDFNVVYNGKELTEQDSFNFKHKIKCTHQDDSVHVIIRDVLNMSDTLFDSLAVKITIYPPEDCGEFYKQSMERVKLEQRASKTSIYIDMELRNFARTLGFGNISNLGHLEIKQPDQESLDFFLEIINILKLKSQFDNKGIRLWRANVGTMAENKFIREVQTGKEIIVEIFYDPTIIFKDDFQTMFATMTFHEIAHKQLDHFSGLTQELEADEYAGGMLARHNESLGISTNMQDYLSVYDSIFIEQDSILSLRKEAFDKGWKHEIAEKALANDNNAGEKIKELRKIDLWAYSNEDSLRIAKDTLIALLIESDAPFSNYAESRKLGYTNLGHYSYNLKEFDEAQNYYKIASQVIPNDSGNIELLFLSARSKFKDINGKYEDDVVKDFEKLVFKSNLSLFKKSEIYGYLGSMYSSKFFSGQDEISNSVLIDSAISYFQKSYEIDSSNSIVCRDYALALAAKQHTNDSLQISALTKAVNLLNKSAELEKNQLTHTDRIKEVEKLLYPMFNELANLYVKSDNYDEASKYAKKANDNKLSLKINVSEKIQEGKLDSINYLIIDGEEILRIGKSNKYWLAYQWMEFMIKNNESISINFKEDMFKYYNRNKGKCIFCQTNDVNHFIFKVSKGKKSIWKVFYKSQ